jgi:hypothetical protein
MATHSITITAIGTSAATVITVWSVWINRNKGFRPSGNGKVSQAS